MTAPRKSNGTTDTNGKPIADPSKNVLDLVDAGLQRQDDLREMQATHLKEMAALRESHAFQMANKESQRLDAIRAVDVGQVQRAAEVQATQAAALAAQVTATAETMRTQVAAAATAAATSLANALEPIQKSIDDLRRAQYEAQGQKTQVVETQATGMSSRAWVGIAIAAAVGVGGLLLSAAAIVVTILLTKGP